MFCRLFYYLEEAKLLDPTNSIHIYSLYYVYIPRINLGLKLFRNAWNKHDLRTKHALTPEQLFVAGTLQLHNSRMVALEFFDNIQSNNYGVVEGGLAVDDNDDDVVAVPENDLQLSDEQFLLLQQRVDPLASSDNHGIELYE